MHRVRGTGIGRVYGSSGLVGGSAVLADPSDVTHWASKVSVENMRPLPSLLSVRLRVVVGTPAMQTRLTAAGSIVRDKSTGI